AVDELPSGPWRMALQIAISFGLIQLGHPLQAHELLVLAAEKAPPTSTVAIGTLAAGALALSTMGQFEEARSVAIQGIELAGKLGLKWRVAQLWDTLGVTEYMADRPHAALRAFNEALEMLETEPHDAQKFAALAHRTATLAILGRTRAAERAAAQTEAIRQR